MRLSVGKGTPPVGGLTALPLPAPIRHPTAKCASQLSPPLPLSHRTSLSLEVPPTNEDCRCPGFTIYHLLLNTVWNYLFSPPLACLPPEVGGVYIDSAGSSGSMLMWTNYLDVIITMDIDSSMKDRKYTIETGAGSALPQCLLFATHLDIQVFSLQQCHQLLVNFSQLQATESRTITRECHQLLLELTDEE